MCIQDPFLGLIKGVCVRVMTLTPQPAKYKITANRAHLVCYSGHSSRCYLTYTMTVFQCYKGIAYLDLNHMNIEN